MQPHRVHSQLHERSKPLDQIEDFLIQLAIENRSLDVDVKQSRSAPNICIDRFAFRMVTRQSLNSCMQVLQLAQQVKVLIH